MNGNYSTVKKHFIFEFYEKMNFVIYIEIVDKKDCNGNYLPVPKELEEKLLEYGFEEIYKSIGLFVKIEKIYTIEKSIAKK